MAWPRGPRSSLTSSPPRRQLRRSRPMTTSDVRPALFSQDWCSEAEVLFATDVAPYIKDPEAFNYSAELRLNGGRTCQFQTEKSQVVWWKEGTHLDTGSVTFILQAPQE